MAKHTGREGRGSLAILLQAQASAHHQLESLPCRSTHTHLLRVTYPDTPPRIVDKEVHLGLGRLKPVHHRLHMPRYSHIQERVLHGQTTAAQIRCGRLALWNEQGKR